MRKVIVTDYLDEIAERFPNKIAFEDENKSVTFSELRDNARRIAAKLIESKLYKKPIVVYMDKSVECVTTFLAVAYSGNFYTPIDVKMPMERVEKIINTLESKVIISKFSYKDKIRLYENFIDIMYYDELIETPPNEESVCNVSTQIIDTDILYVLFTSGSTGIPKGVIIPHRAVIDYVEWFVQTFDVSSDDVFGNQSPLHFDLSIQDVYTPLFCGCKTVLISAKMFVFPYKLINYLREKDVTLIDWVPSALCGLSSSGALSSGTLPQLRMVLFCGEVMPNKHLNIWRESFKNTVFVNLYGPTETCDASTYFIVDRPFSDDESLPIGRGCRNTDIIVLSENNELVSGGEIGELCIRGSSLALGYYNDPEKTEQSFVQNPLNKAYPEKIYRTGDLVKYNQNGEILYVGRKDNQIKHLGHRIELGEIETAVYGISQILQCCAVYDDINKRIVLFCTVIENITEKDIYSYLQNMIPQYMLPKLIEIRDKLPLNLNGKIDRLSLKKSL